MFGDGAEERVGLEASENTANARVHAVAPADVAFVVAFHIVLIGIFPLARIAVGGGEHESAAFALWNRHAVDLDVAHGNTAGHARRRIPAQAFFERSAHERAVRAN